MEDKIRENLTRNYKDLYRFVYRMIGNHELSEDIVQESFYKLSLKEKKTHNMESTRCWLFVVARNLCMDHFRKSKRHGELIQKKEVKDNINPSDNAIESEQRRLLEKAISQLTPIMREAIILREYEKLSYKEISEIIKCPIGTVKSRIASARMELLNTLKPILEVES